MTGGEILIDGIDIRNWPLKKLRDMIGFVPQKGILFSGTIESNLKYGDREASKEVVEEAAKTAQAEEFIDSKPEGFLNRNRPGRPERIRRPEAAPFHCKSTG